MKVFLFTSTFLVTFGRLTSAIDLTNVAKDPKQVLDRCEGDCDNDDDCKGNLICFQRGKFMSVPGCDGTGKKGWDYCIKKGQLQNNIQDFGQNPDSEYTPLPRCGGDCDSDNDCEGNFRCRKRNKFQHIPGCKGDSIKGHDYCVDSKEFNNIKFTSELVKRKNGKFVGTYTADNGFTFDAVCDIPANYAEAPYCDYDFTVSFKARTVPYNGSFKVSGPGPLDNERFILSSNYGPLRENSLDSDGKFDPGTILSNGNLKGSSAVFDFTFFDY